MVYRIVCSDSIKDLLRVLCVLVVKIKEETNRPGGIRCHLVDAGYVRLLFPSGTIHM